MIKVEFIYDDDCPNVAHAREQLQRAFADVGLKPQWQEWNRGTAHSRRDTQHAGDCGCQWEEWNRAAAEIPGYVRDFGSPTVLIDGKDVAGASPANTPDCCRVYRKENGGLDGVPSVDMIASALRQSIENTELLRGGKQRGISRSWLAVLPGVSLWNSWPREIHRKVLCPACATTAAVYELEAQNEN